MKSVPEKILFQLRPLNEKGLDTQSQEMNDLGKRSSLFQRCWGRNELVCFENPRLGA